MDRPGTSFTHEGTGQEDLPVLEAQQALLIETLRRAGGAPVTYDELRERGVELPASVVSELELAGLPIERCYRSGPGTSRRLGVRLDPARDPLAPAALPATEPRPPTNPTQEPDWTPVRIHGRMRLPPPSGRFLVPVALVSLALVAIVVTALSLGGNGSVRRHQLVHQPPARAVGVSRGPAARTPRPSLAPPATPVSETLAAQLETQGHDLLQAGNYTGAVPTLRRALLATGEQVNRCVQPVSQTCLTYAYALYDLGRALRLSGDAAQAVPVLEQRLQIDDQRPVVQTELTLALSHARGTQSR